MPDDRREGGARGPGRAGGAGGNGGVGGAGGASRQELEAAYRNAARTAARSSLLGALGFGVALLMLALLSQRGPSPSPTPVSLEHMLIFGGVFGGIVFTAIASRASRTAKTCRRLLDGEG